MLRLKPISERFSLKHGRVPTVWPATLATMAVLTSSAVGGEPAQRVDNGLRTATVIDRSRAYAQVAQKRARATTSDFRYAIGDQLKITFFEQLAGLGSDADARQAPSLLERTELSGQFVVQLNGDVFLPIVGPIRIAQLTPAQAQDALSESARKAIGGKLKVSVVVVDREPVYVTGTQQRTGVFKHSPGMVVAQVMALAGGSSKEDGDLWKQIDIAREHERINKATERMKRQLAIVDVLSAEQRGAEPTASRRLIEIAGIEAEALVKAEGATRELERAQAQTKRVSVAKLIAALQADLAESRARMDQVAAIVAERAKRSEALVARLRGGSSTESLMVQAKRDVAEIQATWHELRSAISRTEFRLLELYRERDQSALADQIDFERRLRTAQQAVAEDEVMIATIGQLLLKVGPVTAGDRAPQEVSYVVARRTPGGLQEIIAEPLTPLEPGDLVRVVRSGHDAATASIR
ncbi:MAG: polysaccharide biosynthesis/export family protein [Hyphomicrobiaceae bacterium]|nr:polysaccharide biosynthesis/export family protein [Hyphomicrobiaceae bacterium]